jgi:hypothetical protein
MSCSVGAGVQNPCLPPVASANCRRSSQAQPRRASTTRGSRAPAARWRVETTTCIVTVHEVQYIHTWTMSGFILQNQNLAKIYIPVLSMVQYICAAVQI